MRNTREVEKLLADASLDPRVRMVIMEQNERIHVQHEQIMGLAQMFDKMVDSVTEMSQKFNGLGIALDKSGIAEKISDSMKEQDGDPDDTHTHSRRRTN